MPHHLDSKGNIREEKTKPTDRRKDPLPPAPRGGGQAPGAGRLENDTVRTGQQPPPPQRGGQAPGAGRLENDTVWIGQQPPPPQRGGQAPAEERLEERGSENDLRPRDPKDTRKTIFAGVPQKKSHQEVPEESDSMSDPVVGWLVIVKGPGKGKALQLGYNNNIIGRGKTARVQLNFGDNQISRKGHAIVSYDPQDRTFYLEKYQDSTNLTYLNGKTVRNPIELPALSHISIGATVLRFVPLCGDTFDWQDTEESAEA